MQLAWLTDIHLNFLNTEERHNFFQEILTKNIDGILLSGDIAEASSVCEILSEMAAMINKPLYFVLGNHDYYGSEISHVRQKVSELTKKSEFLYWMPTAGIQFLEKDVILLGEDGWADGRYGDYQNSQVSLNDNRMIADLFQKKLLGKDHLLKKMQQLADDDAGYLKSNINNAISQHMPKKIIILTHVPPFKEACLYEGKISSDDFLPFFSSKATGDVLTEVAKANADIEFLVFCGHTHAKAILSPLLNLTIQVGAAKYLMPEIQSIIRL